jgi:hypothetical protein
MHPLRALREAGERNLQHVAVLLAEDVVFRSPIFTRTLIGRDVVARVFTVSSSVRAGRYVREDRLDDRTTFLEWTGQIAGREIESLELITDDEHGLIKERTVALRPLAAVALFSETIYPGLIGVVGPEYWSCTPEDPRCCQSSD